MKPVRIDFCRAPASGTSQYILWLLLIVGVLASGIGLYVGTSLSDKAESLLQANQALQDERVSLDESVRAQEQVSTEMLDAVNTAVSVLNYPSLELLTQLERHVVQDVSVVSVEIGAQRTSLRVVVQAPTTHQALDYLDGIKKEPGFRTAALTRQEPVNGNKDGSAGWRFTFEVPQLDAGSPAVRVQKGREG